jgi:putative endonuclease
MTVKQNLGRQGELLAKDYLLKRGYKLIAVNCRLGRREIDLIVRQGRQPVFIEVKTRLQTPDSLSENPLTSRQALNLKRAIIAYCFKNRLNPETARLDLIVILVDRAKKLARLKHYRNIF